ncbi:MAG: ATP synthase F0 subunit C [Clostridia bacterium]|nr:ATP synthase F0 subunit C [Clostridia bacterium]MBQ7090239.1 ATP synthase F0 subunit C [Clostridia bacterium]
MLLAIAIPVLAAVPAEAPEVAAAAEEAVEAQVDSGLLSNKAWAAAIVVGLAAAAGAIGMAMAISKSVDGIARQPEAEGSIRSTLMLGLVFVETAIIYALVVAILIIFVL